MSIYCSRKHWNFFVGLYQHLLNSYYNFVQFSSQQFLTTSPLSLSLFLSLSFSPSANFLHHEHTHRRSCGPDDSQHCPLRTRTRLLATSFFLSHSLSPRARLVTMNILISPESRFACSSLPLSRVVDRSICESTMYVREGQLNRLWEKMMRPAICPLLREKRDAIFKVRRDGGLRKFLLQREPERI